MSDRAPARVVQGDGYRLVSRDGTPPVAIVAGWSGELEAVLGGLPAVGVNVEATFDDLGRLAPVADRIHSFGAPSGYRGDLSPVNGFRNLEKLTLMCDPKRVDFGSFPRLRSCHVVRAGDVAGLRASPRLEELHLEAPKLADLEQLAPLAGLRSLTLSSLSKLASLGGIEGLGLEDLTILWARVLSSLAPVASLRSLRSLRLDGVKAVDDLHRIGEAEALQELRIGSGPRLASFDLVGGLRALRYFSLESTEGPSAPASIGPFTALADLRQLRLFSGIQNVADLERIGEIVSLEGLILQKGPELASLGFVRPLRSLQYFTLFSTRIADDDLSPLLELPRLSEVTITPERRQYSPTVPALVAALRARGAGASAPAGHAPVAAAGPAPSPPQAKEPGAGELLADVPWRFDETVSRREDLVGMVRGEMADEGAAEWDADRVVVPATRLRLRVAEAEEEAVLDLESDGPEGFRAGELLFKIHQAVGPLVRDTDYLYFEGLVPAAASPGGVPLFDVRLGS